MEKKFNPLVSIIMPVYNGSKYVKKAIDSALAQTYKNIEIIVINDGSTDNSEKIIKQYGKKLKYFKKENGGVATALNLAIERSKGEYISWLSHDDVYLEDKIKTNIEVLSTLKSTERENTILYSNYIVIDKDSKQTWESPFHKEHSAEKLNSPFYPIFNGLIHGCSLLIPKKCFNEVGKFDPKLPTTQDYDLWYRMFPKYNIRFISKPTIKSRSHDEQGSKKGEHFEECDSLWINMINSVDREQINFMYGGLLPFYQRTLKIVSDAKYNGAAKYLKQKINEYYTRNQKDILVSIITPFYNRITWTIEAIKSVMNQTHQNWELILINDASTESIDPIIEIIKKDPRIKLINKVENSGPAKSRNIGIDQAQGEYIAFLDSDDLFLSNKLEDHLTFMLKKDAMISHTSYLLFEKESPDQKIINAGAKDFSYPKIIPNCMVATYTVMTHRDVFINKLNRFHENFRIGEDVCLWIQLSKSFTFKGYDKILTKTRKHEHQAAYNDKTQIEGLTNILNFLISNHFFDETSAQEIMLLNKDLQNLVLKVYEKSGMITSHEISPPNSSNGLKTDNHLAKKIQMKKWLIKTIRQILLLTPGFRKMQILENLIFDNKDKIIEASLKINQLSSIEQENQAKLENKINQLVIDNEGSRTKLETKLDEKLNQFSNNEKENQTKFENKIDQLIISNKENETRLETKLDEKLNKLSINNKKNQERLEEKIRQISINETVNQAKLENKIDQIAINEAINQAKLEEKIGQLYVNEKESREKFNQLFTQDRENQYKLAERLEKIEQLSIQDRENQYKLAERLEKISIENKETLKSKIETQGERLEILFDELKNDVDPSYIDNNVNVLGENIEIPKITKSKTFEYFNESIGNFFKIMKKYILKTNIVLDIGCGIRPQTFFAPRVHICMEPFEEYRKVLKPYFPNKSFFISIKTDALTGIKDFDDNSIDTIFLLDLIEHLDKKEGLALLKEVDRVARKQIVIYTPLGFFPQFYEDKNDKDEWGLSGTLVQKHRSGWLPEDFGQGWDFHICRDAIEPFLEEEKGKNIKYSGLMAIKTKKFTGFPIQSNTPDFVKTLFTNRRGQFNENNDNSRDKTRDNKISARNSRTG